MDNKFVLLLLLIALIFGTSTITIQHTTPISPRGSVTVSLSAPVFDWSIKISDDNYQKTKLLEVKQPGNYFLIADGDAPKGQITIRIEAASGKLIKEIKAAHLKKQQTIYLKPGQYKVIVKSKNAKHSSYRIYISNTK